MATKTAEKIKVTLPKDKETKGTVRYAADQVLKDQDLSIYLPKEVLPEPFPSSIDLEITFK